MRTNGEIAKIYSSETEKLAKAISDIVDVRNRLTYVSEDAKDNNDPGFLLDEALTKLAAALAMTVTYGCEYAKENPTDVPGKDD